MFRKIVVDGSEFEWKYTFDDDDWQEPSHLVFRSSDKTLKMIVYFLTDGPDVGKCPFNTGVSAGKDGQPVSINLNQPRFVAEILHDLLTSRVHPSTKGTVSFRDGTDILRKLGYQFHYGLIFT